MTYTFAPYSPSVLLKNHLRMGGSNPAGERIDVTSLYLPRGGAPWLPVMGEFHFSRCDPDQWETELCKIKAGGVTLVATYLFWIYHEEERGRYDFTGSRDIGRFVRLCRKVGLEVVLRIGPWAHGECRNGGFPDWLLEQNIPLRCDDEAYLALVRQWYEVIYDQVRGLFYKDGGPIVAVQLENELVDNAGHLATLKRMAVEIGFDVPLYTVTGWNSVSGARIPVDEVLPVFAAYADAPWTPGNDPLPLSPHYVFDPTRNDSAVGADLMARVADDGWHLPYERYPYATCEIGPGQQSTYHRRVRISPMDAYAMTLVKLGCGNNLMGYYMYHGGTNGMGRHSTLQESRATGYPNDYPILDYDFDTALSQYGEPRPQYGLLNLLHLFVQDFGSLLAPMEFTAPRVSPAPDDRHALRYAMRTDGRSGFVFVNHHQRHEVLEPVADAVLDTGTVVFPPVTVAGEVAFHFPFGLILGAQTLEWATAQLVCRQGQDYFFAAVPGIPPRYCLDGTTFAAPEGEVSVLQKGDVRIITLPLSQAVFLRKLDGQVYLGENCDLYSRDGQILAARPGSYSYRVWQDGRFVPHRVERPYHPAELTLTPCAEPFTPPYAEELTLGGNAPRRWYRLHVSTDEGFVELTEPCDVEQIYADGQLAADHFDIGRPWRVPASLLFGRECYLVLTPPNPRVYRE